MIIRELKSILKGNTRSSKYKRNSFLLLLAKILSLLINLLLIPITLNYLGVKEYGVWVTLISIISWFIFFDLGLGHGLRNKYAEAKAKGNESDIKKYVSTTFFILIFISLTIYTIFIVAHQFIDYSVLLNAPSSLSGDLRVLALFVAAFFCIRFIVSITNTLLTADQEPSIPSIIDLIGQLLALSIVYLITKTTEPSILYIGIALSASQLSPIVVAFAVLFSTRYKSIIPSLSYYSKEHIKSLFSLGIRFFLIQITALVFFQSNNIIIAHVCGLESVTEYNIAYRYLNVLFTVFITTLTPFWSASTEAYTKGDFNWIKNSLRRLNQLWLLIIVGGIIMILASPLVYKLWLKNTITPDFKLLVLLLIYFILLMRSQMFRYFINGVGKITLQFYVTFFQSLLHIPLAILLGKFFSIYGVVVVITTWALMNALWEQVQCKRIINKTATGIWDR